VLSVCHCMFCGEKIVYDLHNNLGGVNVGIDHDTVKFAMESIRRWWNHWDKELYPNILCQRSSKLRFTLKYRVVTIGLSA